MLVIRVLLFEVVILCILDLGILFSGGAWVRCL